MARVACAAQIVAIEERSEITAMRRDVLLRSDFMIDRSARRVAAAQNSDLAEGITSEDVWHSVIAPLPRVVESSDRGRASAPQPIAIASVVSKARRFSDRNTIRHLSKESKNILHDRGCIADNSTNDRDDDGIPQLEVHLFTNRGVVNLQPAYMVSLSVDGRQQRDRCCVFCAAVLSAAIDLVERAGTESAALHFSW